MLFFRCIKPTWAKEFKDNGDPNLEFIENIEGPATIEGVLPEEDVAEINAAGYNIYWFPNHPSTDIYANGAKWLSGRNIDVFDYLFVDMDLKDGIYATIEAFLDEVSKFPIKPTLTVKSGNGVHAYWNVSDLNRDAYVFAQLGLIKHFKTDPSIFTVLQLMRYPGSVNTKKHGEPKTTEVVAELSEGAVYKLDDLAPLIFNLTEEEAHRGQRHLDKLDGKISVELPADINVDELPDQFVELLIEDKTIKDLFYNPRDVSGDRSKADMQLCNILFKKGFNRKEAINIMANTLKSISKGAARMDYAMGTVDRTYSTRVKNKFMSVAEYEEQGFSTNSGDEVRGPEYFDCLTNKWQKKQVMGIIAGTGVGKTSLVLEVVAESIDNTPESDDLSVLFSLEMPVSEMVGRWIKLVGKGSPKAKRLYMFGNEDEKGNPRPLGLQEMHEIVTELKQLTGKNISFVVIDHIALVSRKIDMRKKYTFGVHNDQNAGYGDTRTLSLNIIATQLKPLAKMLDCFIIALTQTTKEKGKGDIPIEKDGAKGISDYEEIMDYIVTVWQPLMRVQTMTPNHFTAWQYTKIRNKSENDPVRCYEPKLLTFEMATGHLRTPTPEEYSNFVELLPKARDARKAASDKKDEGTYTVSTKVDPTKLKSLINKALNPGVKLVQNA